MTDEFGPEPGAIVPDDAPRPDEHTMWTLDGGLLGVEEAGCSCGQWEIAGPLSRDEAAQWHSAHYLEATA